MINELRIGNWIIRDGIMDQWNEGDFIRYHSSLEPIPLTPEILEKCGFEEKSIINQDQDERDWYEKDGVMISEDLRLISFGPEPELKYVHQLQNLYFALTNTELNIEL